LSAAGHADTVRAVEAAGTSVQRLAPSERRLRRVLIAVAAWSALCAGAYLVQLLRGVAEFPFVVNSVAKDLLLAGVAAIGAADVRRYAWAATTVVAAHIILASVLALALLSGHADAAANTLGALPLGIAPEGAALLWFSADTAIAAVIWRTADKARMEAFGLRYLGYAHVQALAAMTEILVRRDDDHEPAPLEVALRVDRFLASFNAKGKIVMRTALLGLALYPLLSLRPPIWLMHPTQREDWLRTKLVDRIESGRLPKWWRMALQGMVRVAQQLACIGFYGDPAVARRCGFVPFSERDAYPSQEKVVAPGGLRCLTPRQVSESTIDADVVVIGSGAAGATVAAKLVEQGRQVVILERGRHVDPSEFTEHELEQVSALYGDGALTLSTDFRFQVLQGMCVGGSTVVNNAVCFDLPDTVLDAWTDSRGLDCGIDGDRLPAAFAAVKRRLDVTLQSNDAATPGYLPFLAGIHALKLDKAGGYEFGPIAANIRDCLGCGYCTIGCRYGRKLSMLDTVLPDAQQAAGEDGLRILSECLVQRIETDGPRATGVVCTLGDGSELRVRARSVVLAAGALASSVILTRSGIGGDRVGRDLAFNLAVPMFGEFPRRIDAAYGQQMSHYLMPPDGHGFALETWFQPIVALSLLAPGWGAEHDRTMRRFANLACVGTVVASTPTGRVRPARDPRSLRLDYAAAPEDLRRVHDGMKLSGRILLAAQARRVMPPAFRLHEYHTAADLERLPADLLDTTRFSLSTAHPQGGNRMSRDVRTGVVDPEFRVHGMENVHVCDASVFPSAIGVNPQLTVMALAHCAADYVS